jgi:hypothetical protein
MDGHVARTGDEKWFQNVGWIGLQGRDHSEDLDVDRRIILKWILQGNRFGVF